MAGISWDVNFDDHEITDVIERASDRRKILRIVGEFMVTATQLRFLNAGPGWPALSKKTLDKFDERSPKRARMVPKGSSRAFKHGLPFRNQRIKAVAKGFRLARTPLLASGKMYASIKPIYQDPYVFVTITRTGNKGGDVADIHQNRGWVSPRRKMVLHNNEYQNSIDALIEDYLDG